MTDEAKTRFVLEAEAKGFDKVQKAVDQIMGIVDGSDKGVLPGLERVLGSINRELGRLDQAVSRIARSARGLEQTNKGQGGGSGSGSSASSSGGTSTGRGGFVRGVLQGVGMGEYYPGQNVGQHMRQVAGRWVGQTLRGGIGGIANAPFSGMSALIGGVRMLPGIGGPVAAGMENATAAAQEALAYEAAQTEAIPFLDRARGSAARAAAIAGGVGSEKYERLFMEESARLRSSKTDRLQNDLTYGDELLARTRPLEVAESPYGYDAIERAPTSIAGDAEAARRADAFARRKLAGGSASRAMMGEDFAGTGVKYGLDLTQSTQALAQIMQARGGIYDPSGQGFEAALAARNRYGIGLESSGAVMRGVQTGALQGSDGDALARQIGRAMALGLQGSEISEDISRTAEALRQFQSTGMPLAQEARDAIGRTLLGTGMGNAAAAERASALVQGVQTQAKTGLPGDAVGFAALSHLGGYRGGGTEAALQARANLLSGDFSSGGIDQLTRLFGSQLQTGDFGRAYGVEQGFGRLGLSLNPTQALALFKRASGEQLSPELEAAAAEAESRIRQGPRTAAELAAAAPGAGGGERTAAATRNVRIGAGTEALETVQKFERTTAQMASAMTPLVNLFRELHPAVRAIVEATQELTGNISRFSGGD